MVVGMADGEGRSYQLLGPEGVYQSDLPGTLGGNKQLKIFGRLDCGSANRALAKGYARHRVFFLDEAVAISCGYRPCGSCLREKYAVWKTASASRLSKA